MLSVRELRILGEAFAVIIVTWLLLGWFLVDRAITQADGSVLVMPLVRSALEAGPDWTEHLYRVGVLGGSKMHEFAGTMPIVQLCSLLGLSTTTTVNAITIFVQLCFAFFGVIALQALVRTWAPKRDLSLAERAIAVWAFAFMPLFAWRYAYGHENLLFGLLPLWVTVALLLAARTRTLGAPAVIVAAFAVSNGVSGLGPQTLAYSVVFGAPFVLLLVLDAPEGERWRRHHWSAAAALTAGVLLVLPRMAPMLAHAISDDASRSLGESVKASFGTTAWQDWLGSLLWTHDLVATWQPTYLHEHHFALGPLLVLVPFAWFYSRKLVIGIAIGAALAILFAQDIEPVASAFGFLDAFRVPARAIFPATMFIPLLGLGAWFARTEAPSTHRLLLWTLCAAALLPLLRHAPAALVESLAWLGCIVLVIALRWRRSWLPHAAPALALVAVLGIVAFASRFPRNVPQDTIERGPRELRDAAIAQAPELIDPINRVSVVDTTVPFKMSNAFAAGLGSLDGVWYPPKRFLDLISALSGVPVAPTACVFELGDSSFFPVLQQLYNVRYGISLTDRSFFELPEPLGPAWFPRELATIDEPREMASVLAAERDFRPALQRLGWVLARDSTPRSTEPSCADARVRKASSEGQTITVDVESPASCVLVIATNFVTTFRAIAHVGTAKHTVPVFPIDIALTGVSVPAGATRIEVAPRVTIPAWARGAQLLGIIMLTGALVALLRKRRDQ